MTAFPLPKNQRFVNLTDRGFTRWTVLSYAGKSKGNLLWNCQCDCGTVKVVRGCHLVALLSRSCGCLEAEESRARFTTHGMSYTRPFRIWKQMRQRCTNPNDSSYPRYGGRGIKIDPRWDSFEKFWEDMKDGYADHLTLDREDNAGDYTPSNCRWVTYKVQANNSRRNHPLTFKGQTMNVGQWARHLSVSRTALVQRLRKGWSTEEALTLPFRQWRRNARITRESERRTNASRGSAAG